MKHVESPSLAFVKEPPGKLLHHLMSSERVPLVATVVDGEDDLSFKSTSAESPSSCPTKDPSNYLTVAPLDHADAATAQKKKNRTSERLKDTSLMVLMRSGLELGQGLW